jgi:acyl-CoA thioesterase
MAARFDSGPQMEDLKKFFVRDRFAAGSGIELLDVSPGYARAQLQVAEKHLNAVDIVQGGAIFTLADFAFAAASNARGSVAVAINVSISFVKAVSSGILTAEAKETSANPKLATYSVNVTNESGELIAIFQGMVYRKNTPLRRTKA